MDYKKYNNLKLVLGIIKSLLTFTLILLFILLGYSKQLLVYLQNYSSNEYVLLITFTIIVGLTISVIFFPLNFYSDYLLEHKFNLSNQSILGWLWEGLKTTLVGGVIGLPLLLAFYYVLNTYEDNWWLPFAILIFFVSVILAQVVPTLILPLFYKVKPIEDEDLKNRIIALSKNVNLNVENVFQFNMSKNTKKANAAFTGLGKTKKILLGDTLLNEFTNDEIETVIAHELGHYKHKHIIINLIIGTITSFLTLYLLSFCYKLSLGWFGFNNITNIAALPILSLWGMALGIVQTPLTNILSRKHEYQADEYAVKVTHQKGIFINTLQKLNEQNLGDKDPHPFVEWFFHSHPSINNRIKHLNFISN